MLRRNEKMVKLNLVNNGKKYSEPSVPKSSQLAAIYVSQAAKQEVSISKQVEACQKFLNEKGFIFSGDLFLEKEGTDHIDELVRARARSQRFDYLASYLLCPSKSPGFSIGMIVGWHVQNFLRKPTNALR